MSENLRLQESTLYGRVDSLRNSGKRDKLLPYWSFGEQLPAVEEGMSDPSSLGHAYQILARILATRLDWHKALEGETLAPLPAPSPRKLD